MTDNMEIWNQVCETNPDITTEVAYGDRKFTAIDAQMQIKRATELWGPYGTNWGVKDCSYVLIHGAGQEIAEIALDASFYYPGGEFEIASDLKYKTGNDSRKKLLTDVTTKALSKLGFNSDVFEGKFDDNKYVSDMREKAKRSFSFTKENLDAILQRLGACDTIEELTAIREYANKDKANMTPPHKNTIINEIKKVESFLAGRDLDNGFKDKM